MEFVTGYRDPLIDFSELMFHWYRKYVTERGQGEAEGWCRRKEGAVRRLPADGSLWTLHVIRNSRTALTVENPAQQIHERFYNDEVLSFRDLEKYISLINLEEEEEEEELAFQHDHFIHIEYLLLLTDEEGLAMGLDFTLTQGAPLSTTQLAMKAYELLCQGMTFPMCGCDPRRPRQLTIGDEDVQRILKQMIVKLGVRSTKVAYQCCAPRNFTFRLTRVKACHVCKKRSFETTLTACEQCKAVLYCSENCQRLDWSKSPEDSSHRYWCQKLLEFMDHGEALADFPFTYTSEVTSEVFDRELFLTRHELNSGYWLGESMLVSGYKVEKHNSFEMDTIPEFLKERTNPYDPLRKEGAILLQDVPIEPANVKVPFVTWKSYYQWRGLGIDSPVAVLLSCPLTIYHIITSLVPLHFPELNILNKQSLKIHILEAQKQFEIRMVFWELAVLLPHVTFEIHFVGDGLPLEVDKQQFNLQRKDGQVCVVNPNIGDERSDRRNIRIKVCSKPYHMLQGPKADLVIGFNVGFGLSETWLRSLPRLQSLRVPAYFTECSEYSCVIDNQTMTTAAGGSVSRPLLNPFRSPFRIIGIDNNLPWYSNAYLFHLVYKANAVTSRQQAPPTPLPPSEPLPNPLQEILDTSRRKKDRKRGNHRRRK
uniref:zinc finger MYND domain-containing protein 15-like n=1 Tax=Pristiophorus japonicus TaxID=55135 RepID=UPI00398EF142